MFQAHQLSEVISDFTAPWQLAPKPLRDAYQAIETAYQATLEAQSELDDALVNNSVAENQYEQAGLEAVKSGSKAMPNPADKDRARWLAQSAQATLKERERALRLERGNLAQLLGSEDLRKAWLVAVETDLEADRQALRNMESALSNLQAKFSTSLNFTFWLGQFGSHLFPPNMTNANPTGALTQLTNARAYEPALELSTETRWATPRVENPADSEAVFITNDGGATHQVSRAEAEKYLPQIGYRVASETEIRNWYRKQGLTPPTA